MADRKEVNEADLDWLCERDQPLNDMIERESKPDSEPKPCDPWAGAVEHVTPTAEALRIAMDALAAPEWNQDDMICALTNISRLLAAEVALRELAEDEAGERVQPPKKKAEYKCKGCGFPVAYEGDYCGECICEEDGL